LAEVKTQKRDPEYTSIVQFNYQKQPTNLTGNLTPEDLLKEKLTLSKDNLPVDLEKINLVLYPNPVQSILNITHQTSL